MCLPEFVVFLEMLLPECPVWGVVLLMCGMRPNRYTVAQRSHLHPLCVREGGGLGLDLEVWLRFELVSQSSF